MLRLVIAVVSVGLADSLNPSTVGPALYLATVPHRRRRVAEFTVGVFIVNLVAGLLLTIGPGRLLVGLVPHPQHTVKHLIELSAGVILLFCALGVWLGRRRLARRELPMRSGSGSAFVAGGTIAAVELPTALPYFAVVAAIVGSSAGVVLQIVLVALYNVAFVLPLVVILGVLFVAGESADPWLQRGGAWLQRRWPLVLAGLLLLVGSLLTAVGGTNLVRQY
jgi:cytochrome c biogenesis protein CcdA